MVPGRPLRHNPDQKGGSTEAGCEANTSAGISADGGGATASLSEPLIRWVLERESIRIKKVAGHPAPWSNDPIFQTYRFCNVCRSDDRVSQWLIKHVLKEEFIQADFHNFLMFSAFCRWVNWPPTIEGILNAKLYPTTAYSGQKLDWTAIGGFVDGYHALGKKAWTGAYMVRAKPGDNRGKGRFVAEDVIQKSLDVMSVRAALVSNQRQQVWMALQNCLNWGSFMAGQVVADWGYTSLLKQAKDTYTWAPIGPGSKRGFNRLLGRPLNQRVVEEEWNDQLRLWRDQIVAANSALVDMTLHDVQNCLCELDKYLRVKLGQGRPRARYKPETAF